MKILLIDPPIRRFTGVASFYFPTSLAYLAAPLTQTDHSILIYDVDRGGEVPKGLNFNNSYNQMQLYVDAMNDEGNPVWQEVKDLVNKFKPDVVGITAMTTKMAASMKIAELVKECNSKCFVVMGGPHPTIAPADVLASSSVDFVCRNEGEVSFFELIDYINRVELKSANSFCRPEFQFNSLDKIAGISFKSEGKIVHNKDAGFINDLDSIPFPARDRLMNIGKYSSEDIGMILTSRGCPFKCSYCYHPFQASSVKFRSIDNILGEIDEVRSKFGSYQISIKDDSFTVKRSHVTDLCEALIKNRVKINWDCTTRVNIIDDDLLKLMKAAGCNVIKIGVETGSERILKDTNKGITHDQVRRAAKLFNKHRIFWTGYFMMGLPQETKEDIIKTFEFMEEINPFYAGLGVYNPFPNTELFSLGVKMGILKEDLGFDDLKHVNPIDYYFVDPNKRVEALSKDEFDKISIWMMEAFNKHNKGYSKLFKRAWARRKQYLHDPGMVKSDAGKLISWIFSG